MGRKDSLSPYTRARKRAEKDTREATFVKFEIFIKT